MEFSKLMGAVLYTRLHGIESDRKTAFYTVVGVVHNNIGTLLRLRILFSYHYTGAYDRVISIKTVMSSFNMVE